MAASSSRTKMRVSTDNINISVHCIGFPRFQSPAIAVRAGRAYVTKVGSPHAVMASCLQVKLHLNYIMLWVSAYSGK